MDENQVKEEMGVAVQEKTEGKILELDLKKYAKPFLRISISLLYLYFAIQQLLFTSNWTAFVPQFVLATGISANTFVLLNAGLELLLGIMLILGLYTRISSVILSLHLIGIAISIGFNPLGIRDLTIALATFAIFLNGPDELCLDKRMKE